MFGTRSASMALGSFSPGWEKVRKRGKWSHGPLCTLSPSPSPSPLKGEGRRREEHRLASKIVPNSIAGKVRRGAEATAPPQTALTLALSRQRERGARDDRRGKSVKWGPMPAGPPLHKQSGRGVYECHVVRFSINKIAKAHAALGTHLRNTITTGLFCSYHPETPTSWET